MNEILRTDDPGLANVGSDAGSTGSQAAARPRATTKRRIPRWSDLRPLIRARPFELDSTARRLARALTIDDLRRIARRRVPRAVFDFVDGGADEEVSLRRARTVFESVEFRPHVLLSWHPTKREPFGSTSEIRLYPSPRTRATRPRAA